MGRHIELELRRQVWAGGVGLEKNPEEENEKGQPEGNQKIRSTWLKRAKGRKYFKKAVYLH